MTNSLISIEQNEPAEQRRLAAQRQLYLDEKFLTAVQFLIALAGSIGTLLILASIPKAVIQAMALSTVATLLEVFFVQPLRGKKRLDAAKIQELFDCSVLKLDWNLSLVGQEPLPEVVLEAGDRYKEPKEDSLKNWYLGRLSEVPHSIARVICQITNIRYDSSLRKKLCTMLYFGLFVLFVASTLTACLKSLPTDQLFANVLSPLLPLIVFTVMQANEQRKAIEKLDSLRQEVAKSWDLCKKLDADDATLTNESRSLQDKLFLHRSESPTLFEFLYWNFRDKEESNRETLANHHVDEYLAEKSKPQSV